MFDVAALDVATITEIETPSPEELEEMIALLGLRRDGLELRDYGDIVKAKKEGLPEDQKRTALFKKIHL